MSDGAKDARPAGRDWVVFLGARAGAAVERFPAATLFVVLFALAANRLIAVPDDASSDHWRLLLALFGASAAATAVQLALEGHPVGRLLRYGLPTAVGAVYAALVQGSSVGLVEIPLLLLAAILAVPLAPFLGRRRNGTAYWMFFLWGAAGAVLGFVAVMVSISGLTTALELFRLFFGIGPSFDAYVHVYATAFGFVGPMFALASLPATGPQAPFFSQEDRLIRLVRPLLEWIAPALLLLQGAVLHLYAPVAIVSGEGLLEAALLSSSFLLAVFLLRVLLDPFLGDLRSLGFVFARIWIWLIPCPLALILLALKQVLSSYGFDDTAYLFSASAAAVLVVVALQFVRGLRGDIVAMGAVPLVFMLAAAVGPLSVANTVSRGQAALVESRYGERIRSGAALSEDDRRAIRRAIGLLAQYGQTERLEPVLGQTRTAEFASSPRRSPSLVADRLMAALGLPDDADPDTLDEERLRILEADSWRPMATGRFDTVAASVPFYSGESDRTEETDPSLRAEGTILVIRVGAQEDRVDIAPLITGMPQEFFDAGKSALPVTRLTTLEGREIGLRPSYLSVNVRDHPVGGWFTLLLHSSQWTSLGGD